MTLRQAWVLGLVMISACVHAGAAEVNGVQIDPPPKWRAGQGDAISMLWQREYPETQDEEKGAALIQLIVPNGATGTLKAGLDSMVAAIGDMAAEDPIVDETGVTSAGHDMIVQYRCCGDVEGLGADLSSVAVGSQDRQAYLQMVMLNLDDERQDDAEARFAAMVRSLRLTADDEGFTLVPHANGGGLDGVFTYLRTGLMPNVFGGLDFTSESEVTMFAPDGLFTTQLPPAGKSLAGHCTEVPDACGTYRLIGGGWWTGPGQIEMRRVADEFGRIEIETVPFSKNGDDLMIDEEEHRKLPPFAPDTRLDGEWRYLFASSGSTAFSSGSIAVERQLVLSRDGTFARTGWAGASTSTDTGGGTTGVTTSSDRPASAGTYRLDGYTLTLQGGDGQIETLSVFAPDIGSDALLVIDGANYLKQD